MAIRVYLANEHDIIREGLKNILSRNPIINIAGEFTGNGELFSNVDRIKPNLLFIDISTKDDKTLKAISKIKILNSKMLIVALSDKIEDAVSIALNENLNGIFLYDLQSGSEQCLIPIKEGIVEFLQRVDDEIIYCISTDMGKSLISFNINTKEKIILSDSIFNIYDIVKIDKDYYFLGQLVTADDSLYRISNGQINRLVYGFPKKVIVKKEIMLSEENEILFIGKDEDEYVEKVYKSTKDGEISIVKEFNYEVTFVK